MSVSESEEEYLIPCDITFGSQLSVRQNWAQICNDNFQNIWELI